MSTQETRVRCLPCRPPLRLRNYASPPEHSHYCCRPIGYFARTYTTELDAKGEVRVPSHDEKPRGVVQRVA